MTKIINLSNFREHLTEDQMAFFLMLEKAPYLKPLWDKSKAQSLPGNVDEFLRNASHGQTAMARFFLSVWLHNNEHDFDLFESIAVLDEDNRKIIADWLRNPFWP